MDTIFIVNPFLMTPWTVQAKCGNIDQLHRI